MAEVSCSSKRSKRFFSTLKPLGRFKLQIKLAGEENIVTTRGIVVRLLEIYIDTLTLL